MVTVLFSQANHYYCHYSVQGKPIPLLFKILYDYNIISSGKDHSKHHAKYNSTFTFLGYSDFIFDEIVKQGYHFPVVEYLDKYID